MDTNTATKIADKILDDLLDRGGVGQELSYIQDTDPEIWAEIRSVQRDIVLEGCSSTPKNLVESVVAYAVDPAHLSLLSRAGTIYNEVSALLPDNTLEDKTALAMAEEAGKAIKAYNELVHEGHGTAEALHKELAQTIAMCLRLYHEVNTAVDFVDQQED